MNGIKRETMRGKSLDKPTGAGKMNSNPNESFNSKLNGNWIRSISRRISRFFSKENNRAIRSAESFSDVRLHKDDQNLQYYIQFEKAYDLDNINTLSMTDYLALNEEIATIRACTQLARYGWFWGPISRQTAQQRLHGTPNGSFLVRNSQISCHNFTISFRTADKTLHYRIEFVDGYWQTFNSRHRTIVELIEDAMNKSKEDVFCYVKSSPLIPAFPVRLAHPISHFGEITTLQSMCRTVIRKKCRFIEMDELPLPNKLIAYCKEWDTIYGEMPIIIGY